MFISGRLHPVTARLLLGITCLAGFFLTPATRATPPLPPAAVGHPAPVWRFDGEDFYLIDRDYRPGQRLLAFLREGDSPDTCSRRMWLRKVACRDLRSYEKSYVQHWDQSQRNVVYRSKYKLVHSGWVQQGELLKWRMMHWEIQSGALVCAEFELFSRPPSADAKAMRALVDRQFDSWRQQLAAMMKQAPALLEVR